MSEMVNPTVEAVKDVFKNVFWDNAVKAGTELLFAEAPYLNIFGVRQIVTVFIKFAAGTIFKSISLAVDLSTIKIMNGVSQAKYEHESIKLYIIAREKGLDSEEYRKARDEAKIAFSEFVHFRM